MENGHAKTPEREELEREVDELLEFEGHDENSIVRIRSIRRATKAFVLSMLDNCPPGPDLRIAVRYARHAMLIANSTISPPPRNA